MDTERDGRQKDRIYGCQCGKWLSSACLRREAESGYYLSSASPNNPTGGVYNREQLKEWVDYANEQDAILLFDAAYESFVADPALPRSIFEIEGAKTCAIEFCSLSKLASFTGTRCGYTVVPSELERGGSSHPQDVAAPARQPSLTAFPTRYSAPQRQLFHRGNGTVPRAPGRIPHQCEDHDRDLKRAWHLAHRRRKFIRTSGCSARTA